MHNPFNGKRIMVVDDNPMYIDLLKMILSELEFGTIYTANDFDGGIEIARNHPVDIMLLDIDLGRNKKSGIDLALALRKNHLDVPMIFLTAHYNEETYEKARSAKPASFLGKELSKLKVQQAVELALLQSDDETPIIPETPKPNVQSSKYYFKVGTAYKALDIKSIVYFFSSNKITYAKIKDRSYPTNVLLKTLEDQLTPLFVRIHKSYLVNSEFIESIHFNENRIEIGEEKLPLGPAYKKALAEQLNIFK